MGEVGMAGTKAVFIDIETIPEPCFDPEELQRRIREKARKNADPHEWAEKHGDEAMRSCALEPLWGMICCFGVGWYEAGELRLEAQSPTGTPEEDEANALALFGMRLHRLTENGGIPYFVGHNIKGFDLPFIRARCLLLAADPLVEPHLAKLLMRTAQRLQVRDRWGTRECFDTMEEWPCIRYGGRPTSSLRLENISRALGMPAPEHSGGDILDLYAAGKYDEIATHCCDDIRRAERMYRVLTGIPDGT